MPKKSWEWEDEEPKPVSPKPTPAKPVPPVSPVQPLTQEQVNAQSAKALQEKNDADEADRVAKANVRAAQPAPEPGPGLVAMRARSSFSDGNLRVFFEDIGYALEWPSGEVRNIPAWLAQRVKLSGGEIEPVNVDVDAERPVSPEEAQAAKEAEEAKERPFNPKETQAAKEARLAEEARVAREARVAKEAAEKRAG